MNGVHLIVASYGTSEWDERAAGALESAHRQTVRPEWITGWHVPGDADLAAIRNEAAAKHPNATWLIFLDADDQLAPDYVERMLTGTADVRQPATAGVHPDGRVEEPCVIPYRNLLSGNYIVIGAMHRREMFDTVGGFRSLPIYEDWDLWLRLEEQGCTFEAIPDATYFVTVRADSRNNQARSVQRDGYRRIRDDALRRRRP